MASEMESLRSAHERLTAASMGKGTRKFQDMTRSDDADECALVAEVELAVILVRMSVGGMEALRNVVRRRIIAAPISEGSFRILSMLIRPDPPADIAMA